MTGPAPADPRGSGAGPERGAAGDAGNLGELLVDHPAAEDEPLLHGGASTWTKRAAVEEAHRTAGALRAAGVEEGEPVAVRMPNTPRSVVHMAGVWLAGAVLVPLNPRLPEAEVERVTEESGTRLMLDERGGTSSLPGGRRHDPGTAFVLWTSGTTGRPKPILHTHRGYLELLDRVLRPLRGPTGRPADPAKRPAPNLIPVSLALNAGLYNALFGLRAGADLVIMERFEPKAFAELVGRFSVPSTVLPPAAIVALNDDPEIESLQPLRFVRSITAPLSPRQARRFTERFGAFVLNGYGQAEIGEVIGWTAADARRYPERVGAAGRPHPGVGIKVVDETGSPVETGAVGELLVRPPSMAAGYASGAELADRLDAEGFVRTGDLAAVDDAGFVWLHGRVGDLINRGGNKVFPEEVEEVLRQDPAVTDAAVAGAPDERLGQVPVALVVSAGPVDASRLERLCREHLVPYKVPVRFEAVDEVPRNEAGKILRRELVRRLEGAGSG